MIGVDVREVWKDVKGYEGLYAVSNLGNIYSYYMKKQKKQSIRKDGYKFVVLKKNGKQKYMMVHRLVAEAFIPNPENLPMINHKDENPLNNCIDNLEWCTALYNNTYNDVHIKRGKSLSKKVYAYDEYGSLYGVYDSTYDIANKFGMSNSNVTTVCNSDYRTFNGLVLSYKELSEQEVLDRFERNKIRKNISENIGEYIKQTKSKTVNQYDLKGNFICSYPSTQEAGRQLGFSSSAIASVCRGEHKQTHGFKFEYA